MAGHAGGKVHLGVAIVHPLLVGAKVEEVGALHLSGRVARVHVPFLCGLERLLNVPEHVRRNSVEDLVSQRSLETFRERVLQIVNEIVALAASEDRQLAVQDISPKVGGLGVELVEQLDLLVDLVVIIETLNRVGSIVLLTVDLVVQHLDFLVVDVEHKGTVSVTAGASQRIEDLLLHGTSLVLLLAVLGFSNRIGLVVLELLADLVEVLVFLLAEGQVLLGLLLVVGHVDVLHGVLNLRVVHFLDVILELVLVASALDSVLELELGSMLQLEQLKTNTLAPLLLEFLEFLVGVVGGRGQLGSPEGHVRVLGRGPGVRHVLVDDGGLIEPVGTESPNLVLLDTVIDNGHVTVGGVIQWVLTESVVPSQLIFLVRDHTVDTNGVRLFGLMPLGSLEVISLLQHHIIPIVHVGAVGVEGLVPPHEGVVEGDLLLLAAHDFVTTHVHTIE